MSQFEQGEPIESTVDLKEYLYLFWSWAWLILLAGIVAGVAAYVVSIYTTPIYQSSTSLLVSAPSTISGVDPTALVTTQTMTSTYAQMLLDRPVLQGVVDQLKLQTTPDELKNSITVSALINTQLLVVTVQDQDPTQAANIANALASVFSDRIRQLQSQRYAASSDGLQKQISDMDSQITDTNDQISKTSDPATLQQLQARLTQYRTIYANLVTSYEQVSLAEEQTSTNVVVSEPAVPDYVPVSPKTLRNTLLATLAGMLLSAGVIFAIDTLDDTIRNPDEIRRKFDLPILGMIEWHETAEGKPISMNEPRSPTAEAFRSLRTNLTFAGVDTPLRRILITSAAPQEGKTTISANLAVVMAQGDKKVVLVDADLRRPQIHQKFGLPNRNGLTDLFIRPLDSLYEVMHSNGLPRLGVITAGALPANPAELITSQRMSKILDRLNQENDLILIDTPPVLTVTDAAALAPSMDGVLLVAKPGKTKLSAFKQTVEQLRAVGARVLGVVFNEVSAKSRKYGYYYNRHYSKYSSYYKEPATKPVKPDKPTEEPAKAMSEEKTSDKKREGERWFL